MGWGSGVYILDEVLTKVFERGVWTDDAKTYLTRDLIEVFWDNDCDTFDDSKFDDQKWFRRALYLAEWIVADEGEEVCMDHYDVQPCWYCEREHKDRVFDEGGEPGS